MAIPPRAWAALKAVAFAIAGLALVGWVSLITYVDYGHKRVTGTKQHPKFSISGAQIFFGDRGKLIAIGEGPAVHVIDLATDQDSSATLQIPDYTNLVVNDDASSWAAIYGRAVLFNGRAIQPPGGSVGSISSELRDVDVVALTFTNTGALIALLSDGNFAKVADSGITALPGESVDAVFPLNAGGTRLLRFKDTLAAVNFELRYAALWNTGDPAVKLRYYRWSENAADAILLSEDRAAVRTNTSILLLSPGPVGQTAIMKVLLPGRVAAWTPYGRDSLLIAFADGTLRRVDAAGKLSVPPDLPAKLEHVRSLAAAENTVAYATESEVIALEVVTEVVETPLGKTIPYLAVLAALGVLYVAYRINRRRTPAAAKAPLSAEAAAAEAFELPPPPSDLAAACAAGDCVLYVGSQLAVDAGLGTPAEGVEILLGAVIAGGLINGEEGKTLRSALAAGEVDLVLDAIASAQLTRPSAAISPSLLGGKPGKTYRLLGRIPFAAYISSTLDDLLERSVQVSGGVLGPSDVERMLELNSRRESFVLKLRGTISHPQSFEAAVAQRVSFAELLANLMLSRTMLFVGASLDEISSYLTSLRVAADASGPHYALVSVSDDDWKARAAFLERRFRIQVLPYTGITEELNEFFSRLAADLERSGVPAADGGPSRLLGVELRNIGPFKEQDFSFDGRWTVLLGDNGVGKSNVLRALAVALAGKDAAPYAARIVKADATQGTITVRTTRGRYVTKINKRSDDTADVVSQINLLEAERWLALGFPPLRALTWQRGASIGESRSRSTPRDVLPLVAGGADPRVDELKSWIIEQRVKALDEQQRTKSDQPTKYDRLLETFFEVVNKLTPKLQIRLGQIDVTRKEVKVITDDGPVPIELISQGTISLIGWIGVLLQRLFEVYGDAEGDPLDRYALVLIDEIDAHMHPGWQKELAPLLTEAFTNAQFVATTHSPLIVSELRNEQVFILTRDEGRVIVERPEEDLSAMRADQMLTSLFRLPFTRNRQTEKEVSEYARLLGMTNRNAPQERRFRQLREELSAKLTVSEGPVDRGVEKVVRSTVAEVKESAATPAVTTTNIPEEAAAKLKEQLKELFNDEEPQ